MGKDSIQHSEIKKVLKDEYGLFYYLTEGMTVEEMIHLKELIDTDSSVFKLQKNALVRLKGLSNNNRDLGKRRSKAEKNAENLEEEKKNLQNELGKLYAEYQVILKQFNSSFQVVYEHLTKDVGSRSEIIRGLKQFLRP